MCTTLVDVTTGLSSAAAHVTSRIAISFYGRAETLSPKLVTKNIMVNECEVIFFLHVKYILSIILTIVSHMTITI